MRNLIKHHWNTTVTGGLVNAVLNEPISANDENANEFSVTVQNANFDSATCQGFFIRGDGKTIVLDGQVSGKTAYVLLAPNCYNVTGRFTITVKVTKGESTTSWLRVEGYVKATSTDDYAFAGDDSAPLDTLLEAAEIVDEAVSEANEAANAANEAAQAAENVLALVEETLASIQEDYTELAGEVGKLSEEIGAVVYTAAESEKRSVQNTWTGGYLWFNGSAAANDAYAYSDPIDVLPGDVISCVYTVNNTAAIMRFIEARNENGIVDTENNEVTSYTVPDGANQLRLNVYSSGIDKKVLYIERNAEKAYPIRQRDNFIFSQTVSALPANTKIKLCDHVDNKKNYSYLFTGFFDSFSTLEIGHGTTEYGAVYLRITNTDIQTIAYNGTVYQTFEHGLTLSDFIAVNIKGGEDVGARAEITIRTNGGSYSTTNVIFFGCNGAVYAVSETAMTDVVFDYVVADMKKDVFVFGDSYTSLADNMKFPYYLLNRGYTNYLLAGFGGATANNGLLAFREICDKQKPKYVVWLLGMNNPDDGAINASWLTCTETVIAYCESHKIVPILATIPNTPSMENTYKNEWVRNSGHRYVDFAKAVGAETSGSAWYTGMLSSDNVHPDVDGAKVLSERILIDVPEIIQ